MKTEEEGWEYTPGMEIVTKIEANLKRLKAKFPYVEARFKAAEEMREKQSEGKQPIKRVISKEQAYEKLIMMNQLALDQITCKTSDKQRQFVVDQNNEQALDQVANWLTGKGKRSLLITGGVGTGKSLMVRAIRMLKNSYAYLDTELMIISAVKVAEVFQKESTSKYDEVEEIQSLMKDMHRVETLAVDDLGVEETEIKSYGTVRQPFTEIFFYRYEKNLPIIVTTNLKINEIEVKYGVRCFDRLTELCEYVKFFGGSRR